MGLDKGRFYRHYQNMVLDAIEKLVWDAEISAAVLGGRHGEVVLVYLDGPTDNSELLALATRGTFFVGAVGLVNGRVEIEPEEPGCAESLRVLARAAGDFAQSVAKAIGPLKLRTREWGNA